VPLSRDELVSDWQSRLAVAESLVAESASHSVWLARVQRRICRFLLSLYGRGQWRASALAAEEIEVPAGGSQAVVFDSPEVLPLVGKPAKETGKIRAVLKSLAAAQDQPLAAGPLAAGLRDEPWVIVAALKPRVNPQRYVTALKSRKLPVRVVLRTADMVIVVPAGMHQTAIAVLLEERRCALSRQSYDSRRRASLFQYLSFGALLGPFLGILLAQLASEVRGGLGPAARAVELLAFFGGWLLCVVIAGLLATIWRSSGDGKQN
jgi:hypothetical protein